jgi:hypothetical protein
MLWLIALLQPAVALAEVPYRELERLRQLSIVTRVVLDDPDSALARNCGVDTAGIGGRLQLEIEGAAGGWEEMEVTAADLSGLKNRVGRCEARGSCQLYGVFLETAGVNAAAASTVKNLRTSLETRLQKLEAKSFVRALDSVPDPCGRLRELGELE